VELDDWLMLSSYDDLLSYLRRQGATFAEVAGQPAVELATHQPPVEGVLGILWHPDLLLVQFVHPLPFEIKPEYIPAVEHALLLINHALVFPGFGFNHAKATAYFRLVISHQLEGGISEDEAQRAISTVMVTLRDFWKPLRAVAEGASPEAVLATDRYVQ
jgi:hypothetical protein